MAPLFLTRNLCWELLLYLPSVFLWLMWYGLLPEPRGKIAPFVFILLLLNILAAFVLSLLRSLRKPNFLRFLGMGYALLSGFYAYLGMMLANFTD